jgi:uncharacterized membrane protein YgcG
VLWLRVVEGGDPLGDCAPCRHNWQLTAGGKQRHPVSTLAFMQFPRNTVRAIRPHPHPHPIQSSPTHTHTHTPFTSHPPAHPPTHPPQVVLGGLKGGLAAQGRRRHAAAARGGGGGGGARGGSSSSVAAGGGGSGTGLAEGVADALAMMVDR